MKFQAKRFSSKTSNAAALLIRGAACVLPTVLSTQHGLETGIVTAVALGLVNGWSRLWVERTASSFNAEASGLRIDLAGSTQFVPWADVCAIQVWRRINDVVYVLLHYRREDGLAVASCWEQHGQAGAG